MNNDFDNWLRVLTPRPPRPYWHCFATLAGVWIGSLVIVLLASWGRGDGIIGSVILPIGFASGIVALLAAFPGVIWERLGDLRQTPEQVTVGFSVGTVIRLIGTVALVGLCRYHMPAVGLVESAAAILGWYVFLTSIDVIVLATLLPRLDQVRREGLPRRGTQAKTDPNGAL